MLDADSVFERLLKEATNLLPKMSTPKLSAALKLSTELYQSISEIVASRVGREQGFFTKITGKNRTCQSFQPFVETSMISEELAADNAFLTTGDSQLNDRPINADNYTTIPLFPQFSQFTVNTRGATLVAIANPPGVGGGSATAGAVAEAVGLATAGTNPQRQMILPLPTVPLPLDSVSKVDQSVTTKTVVVTGQSVSATSATAAPKGHTMSPLSHIENPEAASLQVGCDGDTKSGPQSLQDQQQQVALFPSPPLPPPPNQPSLSSSTSGTAVDFIPVKTTAAASTSLPQSLSPTAANLSTASAVMLKTPGNPPSTSEPSISATASSSASADNGVAGGGGGPYRCPHCQKEFRVLRYLEKHKRIHTGEKPYQCCFCGRLFNDWPNMNRHKRIHTGERPYRCSVCSKTFSQPAVYNEHVKRHTGERPFVCTVCSKGFPRAARLNVHMRVHTGEKPYSCSVCQRRFSQPHHLSTHVRIHSGDRHFRLHHLHHGRQNAGTGTTPRQQQHQRKTSGNGPTTTDGADTKASSAIDACQSDVEGTVTAAASAATVDLMLHHEDRDVQERTTSSSSMEGSCDTASGNLPMASPKPLLETSTAQTAIAESFCVPSQAIFDQNGNIYISSIEGTSSGLAPVNSTVSPSLPQIQIQGQPLQGGAFLTDPHHHLQPQCSSIQICYPAAPNAGTQPAAGVSGTEPSAIIVSPGAKGPVFTSMFVSSFPYTPGGTAFQATTLPVSAQTITQQPGMIVSQTDLSSSSNSTGEACVATSPVQTSSIVADA